MCVPHSTCRCFHSVVGLCVHLQSGVHVCNQVCAYCVHLQSGGVSCSECLAVTKVMCCVLQVHRFHPPLAYGRTMGCAPDASVGAALCRVDRGITGKPCYGVITYA